MGGGGGAESMFGLGDPALMAAVPQLSLAQAMMQEGTKTDPVMSPYQAVARVLNAGAGNVIQNKAFEDLAHAYGAIPGEASKALPANHPLQAFLQSQNPLVRMIGVQGLKSGLVQMGEGMTQGVGMGPGGASPVKGYAGAAAVAPATRAGAEAAATAPYTPGGTAVVTGEDNVPREVPITADTRLKMQPGTQGMGPKNQPAVPTDRPKLEAPGTATAPGPQGKPLANPAIEPMVHKDTEEVASDRRNAELGQKDMATVKSIHDLMQKTRTGWGAETKLEAANILKGLGADDKKVKDFLGTDLASGQVLNKKFLELSAGAARQLEGAHTASGVMSMFHNTYPSLGTDEHAIKLQTNALYMDRLRLQHLAQEKTDHVVNETNRAQNTGQYRGLKGFNEKFNTDHPAEYYLHAAEAMSGDSPWKNIKKSTEQDKIIQLIPSGSTYLAPDGKWRQVP